MYFQLSEIEKNKYMYGRLFVTNLDWNQLIYEDIEELAALLL